MHSAKGGGRAGGGAMHPASLFNSFCVHGVSMGSLSPGRAGKEVSRRKWSGGRTQGGGGRPWGLLLPAAPALPPPPPPPVRLRCSSQPRSVNQPLQGGTPGFLPVPHSEPSQPQETRPAPSPILRLPCVSADSSASFFPLSPVLSFLLSVISYVNW